MSCVSFMRQQCSGNQNSPNLQTLGIKERYNVMENSTEWLQTNNSFFVLNFFSILSPAKRPFQADGSKWLKRLLLVANRDRPCTFVHFLTPPPPISLPSLSPMTSVLFKHLESLRKSSCAVHRIRNYPQNYWSFLVPVSGLADLAHRAKNGKP